MRNVLSMILILMFALVYCSPINSYDVIISGGTIVDGTGQPAYKDDIGIRWDKIAKIGNLTGAKAKTVIDAEGKIVTPGFIDLNCRSQYDILADGSAMSKLQQGVTTIILGNDHSPGPVYNQSIKYAELQLSKYNKDIKWTYLYEYLDHLQANGIAVNVGSFIGVRQMLGCYTGFAGVMLKGYRKDEFYSVVNKELHEGVLGISVSFNSISKNNIFDYDVSSMANEFNSNKNAVIANSIRYSDERAPGWIKEILLFNEHTDFLFELKEMKLESVNDPEIINRYFDTVNELQSLGNRIQGDISPFPYYLEDLSEIIPYSFKKDGWDQLSAGLRSPEILKNIETQMINDHGSREELFGFFEKIRIIGVNKNQNKQYIGKTLSEIVGSSDEFMNVIAELILSEPIGIETQYETLNPDFIKEAVKKDWVKFSSGAPTIPDLAEKNDQYFSLLSYAAFPAALAYFVRDNGLLKIEEAVQKMTSMNADLLKIEDRGRLIEGLKADIAVIDLSEVSSDYSPVVDKNYKTGVHFVLVNGYPVYESGKFNNRFPGEIIRRNNK
ncbi:amidohydrolase family protein [candidate division KSB1 bacterium]